MSLLKFADIEEQCAQDNHLKREDIAKLEEWQLKQPHLPSPFHPIETALFLHTCFYSIEAAKQFIDTYYTFRKRCPDFYARRDPFCPEMQLCLNTIIATILPKLTSYGDAVFYGQLRDCNPEVFNLKTLVKLCDMLISMSSKQNGCWNGFVVIINFQGFTMQHLLKCQINTVKNALISTQCALPIRLKSIHLINNVPFADAIVALIKPFFSKKLNNLVKVHFGKNETLFKFLPRNILPIECGGEDFYADEHYRNVTRKEIEIHYEFFKIEEQRLVDETKRPYKPPSDMDLFGVDGTFKKVAID